MREKGQCQRPPKNVGSTRVSVCDGACGSSMRAIARAFAFRRGAMQRESLECARSRNVSAVTSLVLGTCYVSKRIQLIRLWRRVISNAGVGYHDKLIMFHPLRIQAVIFHADTVNLILSDTCDRVCCVQYSFSAR